MWSLLQGKPSAKTPKKKRFFQLSHDGSTLRWSWNKYIVMYYVEVSIASGRQLNVSFHKSWNTICEYILKQVQDPFLSGNDKRTVVERPVLCYVNIHVLIDTMHASYCRGYLTHHRQHYPLSLRNLSSMHQHIALNLCTVLCPCVAIHGNRKDKKEKEKVYAVRRDRETSDRPWRPVAALS